MEATGFGLSKTGTLRRIFEGHQTEPLAAEVTVESHLKGIGALNTMFINGEISLEELEIAMTQRQTLFEAAGVALRQLPVVFQTSI